MRRVVVAFEKSIRGGAGGVLMLLVLAGVLPAVAQASTVTFDWVPFASGAENPTSAASNPASGTLTLNLPSFSLTTQGNPAGANYGPYYSSGTDAASAEVVGLQYTFADGAEVTLSEVTGMTLATTSPWVTTGLENDPENVPTSTPEGYYLVSAFTLSGTADGVGFKIANGAGHSGGTDVDGGTYNNPMGNGDNSFNGTSLYPSVTDGGYWELAPASVVPLPPGLPLLLSGLGLLVCVAARKGFVWSF
jgi:hypothetical protein